MTPDEEEPEKPLDPPLRLVTTHPVSWARIALAVALLALLALLIGWIA